MDISFNTAKLQKLCNSDKKMRGVHGPIMAKVLQRRLLDLAAVESLDAMRVLPGHCHELRVNLKGCLAVDLVQPDRLVFRPDHDPIPTVRGGGLDWKKVTAIQVVGIGDYH